MVKTSRIALALASLAAFSALAAAPAVDPSKQAALADVQRTLGHTPAFLDAYPDAAVAAWWDELKNFQMNPNTALSGRVKELIGLGVAAQVPCEYCTYFHAEAAKVNGATTEELKEAVAMAAITRHMSTVLNGSQQTLPEFKTEIDAAFAYAKAGKSAPMPIEQVTDGDKALADIGKTFGSVPSFFKRIPKAALPGAWKQFRQVQLSGTTKLSGKEKELIGLAVAAQVPCAFCVYAHTEAAKMNGATQAEVDEAVAMAAVTRLGSTILNGGRVDPVVFKKDMDKIFANARRTAAK
jgi:AhpD family alkylhydroperoxidase